MSESCKPEPARSPRHPRWTALAFAFAVALLGVGVAHAVPLLAVEPSTHYADVGAVINASTAATETSTVVDMRGQSGMSVQIDHGNIVGALALQSSNDDTTYYAVQGGGFSAISGSGGEVVEIGSMRSRYYRFVYTHSSGTGLLKVTVHLKGK